MQRTFSKQNLDPFCTFLWLLLSCILACYTFYSREGDLEKRYFKEVELECLFLDKIVCMYNTETKNVT